MEIEVLVSQAFQRLSIAVPTATLAPILDTINEFSIEELMFNPHNDLAVNATINSLHQAARQALTRGQVDNVAYILQAADLQLSLFFKNKDVVALMRFIHINLPLHIPYQKYPAVQYQNNHLTECATAISELLHNVNININLPTNASYHEKELEANARQGYTEGSIKKVYDFVSAVERGGRGFHLNGYLEKFIAFLSELDITSYLLLLDSRTKIEEYIMYFQGLSKPSLLECSTLLNQMTNGWGVFELLRQILQKENKNQSFQVAEHNSVCLCLKALYRISADLYFQTITYFHDSPVLNSALGEQLAELTEQEIEELINQALPIKTNDQLINYRTMLLENAASHLPRGQYHKLLKSFFLRWDREYKEQFKDPDAFCNTLFLTSHANFVIYYYNELVDPIIAEIEMKKLLNQLLWIDCEWFQNVSQQVTSYYLYLSKLYLISYSYKSKSIVDEDIKELIRCLMVFQPASDYINNKQYPDYIAEITSNLLQLN